MFEQAIPTTSPSHPISTDLEGLDRKILSVIDKNDALRKLDDSLIQLDKNPNSFESAMSAAIKFLNLAAFEDLDAQPYVASAISLIEDISYQIKLSHDQNHQLLKCLCVAHIIEGLFLKNNGRNIPSEVLTKDCNRHLVRLAHCCPEQPANTQIRKAIAQLDKSLSKPQMQKTMAGLLELL